LRVWDAKSGKQLRELQGHTDGVTSVSFSGDGSQIVSGSYDRSVRVWDAKSGKQLRELQGHTNFVTSVSFLRGGNSIVSGSADKSIRMWVNLNLDALWVLDHDGWILSCPLAERLAWVPSTISNVLLRPHNTLILSRNGSATIDFTQCKLGTSWHECYTPC
jgi:WD40 repeat protein